MERYNGTAMAIENLVWKIVKQLTTLFPDEIVYGYKYYNATETAHWWMISISTFDVYKSERFKKITQAWHKAVSVQTTEKVIFSCCNPSEKELAKLLENNNLIMAP